MPVALELLFSITEEESELEVVDFGWGLHNKGKGR
jgi:hypothetical protein